MSKYITLEIGISGWREYIFFLIICTAFRVVQPFGASATAIGATGHRKRTIGAGKGGQAFTDLRAN
jgi:hypothetical protein